MDTPEELPGQPIPEEDIPPHNWSALINPNAASTPMPTGAPARKPPHKVGMTPAAFLPADAVIIPYDPSNPQHTVVKARQTSQYKLDTDWTKYPPPATPYIPIQIIMLNEFFASNVNKDCTRILTTERAFCPVVSKNEYWLGPSSVVTTPAEFLATAHDDWMDNTISDSEKARLLALAAAYKPKRERGTPRINEYRGAYEGWVEACRERKARITQAQEYVHQCYADRDAEIKVLREQWDARLVEARAYVQQMSDVPVPERPTK